MSEENDQRMLAGSVRFDDAAIEEGNQAEETARTSTSAADNTNTNNNTSNGKIGLSVVSKAYDRGDKGYLDETEQKMRGLDKSGKGYLKNETVYDLVKESLEMQKKMVTQRWLIIGLTAFAVVLALANMGTAFAAASLAKDTTVTQSGELAVKGNEDTTVTTTAKGKTFSLGAPLIGEEGERRRRRLAMFDLESEYGEAGHSSMAIADVQALFFTYESGIPARVKWNCGVGGQGMKFVEEIRGGALTRYRQNMTSENNETTYTASGILYEFQVGGGMESRFSGARSETQKIIIDCAESSEEGGDYFLDGMEPFCTVSGTGCCMTWFDETTGEMQDDCPEYSECSPCGCHCIEAGLLGPSCNSGCDQTDPYFIAGDKFGYSGFGMG